MSLHLDRPWLTLDMGAPHQVLSWAINRPGFVVTNRIVWREVRNADLPPDLDVRDWFARALDDHGSADAVAFLTSRDIRAYHDHSATIGATTARCVATVGLSNAEHIGTRLDRSSKDWGTINVAVQVSTPLARTGLIEALSIAAQARTVAVMAVSHDLPTGIATGTGTDCIAVAAPQGQTTYTGLHTEVGEAIGRATHDAVLAGAREWMQTVRREGEI